MAHKVSATAVRRTVRTRRLPLLTFIVPSCRVRPLAGGTGRVVGLVRRGIRTPMVGEPGRGRRLGGWVQTCTYPLVRRAQLYPLWDEPSSGAAIFVPGRRPAPPGR